MNSFFIINDSGSILVEKHYHKWLPRSCCKPLMDTLQHALHGRAVAAFHYEKNAYVLLHIWRKGLFFVAVVLSEVNSFLIYEMLERFYEILVHYFKDVSPEILQSNFSTVLLLLNEMFDGGVPAIMEPNLLDMLVHPPSVFTSALQLVSTKPSTVFSDIAESIGLKSAPSEMQNFGVRNEIINQSGIGEGMGSGSGFGIGTGLSGSGSDIWWRKGNTDHSSNEILLDILEKLSLCMDVNGNVLSGGVSGDIRMNCRLTGIPELCLSLKNQSLLNNAAFHPCVSMQRFQRDHQIFFCPPEGVFSLATYWYSSVHLQPPLSVKASVTMDGTKKTGVARFRVSVNRRMGVLNASNDAYYELQEVTLLFSLPAFVAGITVTSPIGLLTFNQHEKTLFWKIGRLTKEMGPITAEGSIFSETDLHNRPSWTASAAEYRFFAQVFFVIKGWVPSGLKVLPCFITKTADDSIRLD